MATRLHTVLEQFQQALAPPDGQLLTRFVASRDEAAFAALVRRHGPMVLGVCRRLLRHAQDAEDCFQATFLVLARKASSVRREAVGSWLYAVAYRTSLEARSVRARRRVHEKQVEAMPHPEIPPVEPQDWRPWLDHELNLLPEHYRAVIVACDLEGRSRKEAARQLGLSEGTVSSRLARGRCLLAKRLSRYGLSLSGGALAAALAEGTAPACIPGSLLSSMTKAAVGQAILSRSVDCLVKGALKTMLLAKLKVVVGALMVVVALAMSGLVYRASGQPAPVAAERKPDSKPRSELEALRHENELLKLNLEVVLEKVRAQEAELRALRGNAKSVGKAEAQPETDAQKALQSDFFLWAERADWSRRMSGRGYITRAQAEADEARSRAADRALRDAEAQLELLKRLQDAEVALKALREAPNQQTQRHAADQLEKALKALREQMKRQEGPAK
jgi:RNA polymerase sigma factor (sigma-70 family)